MWIIRSKLSGALAGVEPWSLGRFIMAEQSFLSDDVSQDKSFASETSSQSFLSDDVSEAKLLSCENVSANWDVYRAVCIIKRPE